MAKKILFVILFVATIFIFDSNEVVAIDKTLFYENSDILKMVKSSESCSVLFDDICINSKDDCFKNFSDDCDLLGMCLGFWSASKNDTSVCASEKTRSKCDFYFASDLENTCYYIYSNILLDSVACNKLYDSLSFFYNDYAFVVNNKNCLENVIKGKAERVKKDALEKNDYNICNNIDSDEASYIKNGCFRETALKTKDWQICKNIKNANEKESCILEVIQTFEVNDKDCQNKTYDEKAECYYKISSCNLIDDVEEHTKGECFLTYFENVGLDERHMRGLGIKLGDYQICEYILDPNSSKEKAECIIGILDKFDLMNDECKYKTDNEKIKCYYDISPCNSINNEQIKSKAECYLKYFEKTNTELKEVAILIDIYSIRNEFYHQALLCEEINDIKVKDLCYLSASKKYKYEYCIDKEKNYKICEEINDIGVRDSCYLNYSLGYAKMNLNDKICELIQDKTKKDNCYRDISYEIERLANTANADSTNVTGSLMMSKMNDSCQKISDPEKRNMCKLYTSNYKIFLGLYLFVPLLVILLFMLSFVIILKICVSKLNIFKINWLVSKFNPELKTITNSIIIGLIIFVLALFVYFYFELYNTFLWMIGFYPILLLVLGSFILLFVAILTSEKNIIKSNLKTIKFITETIFFGFAGLILGIVILTIRNKIDIPFIISFHFSVIEKLLPEPYTGGFINLSPPPIFYYLPYVYAAIGVLTYIFYIYINKRINLNKK